MRYRLLAASCVAALFLAAGPVSAAGPGDLLKLACPAGTKGNHPCRAVYYWGADGRRHAFPNAATYFTWYVDWNGVKTVDATSLAALPLGHAINYRPGSRLLKLPLTPTVYAVDARGLLRPFGSETVAATLYGPTWRQLVDDLPEAFASNYTFGASIAAASDFNPAARQAAAPTIEADSGSRYEYRKVATAAGTFDAHVVTLARDRFRMKTYVAAATDCADDCAAKPLLDYAKSANAAIGIHGSYFCPPDYAGCADKTYTFRWPVYDSGARQLRNASEVKYHDGPLAAEAEDGQLYLYRDARTFVSAEQFQATHQSPLDAALANYPTLLVGGAKVVESEPRLDQNQRTVKGTRGGLGWNGDSFFLVVAKSATVVDLADVMAALGASDALNLDGGGSSALLYGGAYKIGPGRLLPNAVIFAPR